MRYLDFHLRYVLSLFSMATTEGSDVIAFIPSTYAQYYPAVTAIIVGMFVLAFMNAKGTIYAHK